MMHSHIRKITNSPYLIVLLFTGILVVIVASGCATAHGFGKDMEGAGKDIQRETR
jgi:predicted small secreted protein